MQKVTVDSLPGGLRVAAGGTRTAIKLDRPWQTEIRIDRNSCPFEAIKPPEGTPAPLKAGWRVLPNAHTPYNWHKLVVPEECWSVDELRELGGKEQIAAAVSIAESFICASQNEFWLGVHIGPSAGQNLGHLHYHLIHPFDRSPETDDFAEVVKYCASSKLVIFEDSAYRVVAGGFRAGQCFFVPLNHNGEINQNSARQLATTVTAIISLYNRKFRSKQGMLPDFMLGLKYKGGRLLYCTYLPVLNNWGFTEYLGLLERTPLLLPWPHETTVEFLREP